MSDAQNFKFTSELDAKVGPLDKVLIDECLDRPTKHSYFKKFCDKCLCILYSLKLRILQSSFYRNNLIPRILFVLFCLAVNLAFAIYTNAPVSSKDGTIVSPKTLGCRDTIHQLNYNSLLYSNGHQPVFYRCPALCAYNSANAKIKGVNFSTDGPYILGNKDEGYSPFSWACAAAIHAGVTKNFTGGCFTLRASNSHPGEIEGRYSNGLFSGNYIGDRHYPSYTIEGDPSMLYKCADHMVPASFFNIASTSLVPKIFKDPKSFFVYSVVASFWTVVLYHGTHDAFWIVAATTRFISVLMYSNFFFDHFCSELFGNYNSSLIFTLLYTLPLFVGLLVEKFVYTLDNVTISGYLVNYETVVVAVLVVLAISLYTIFIYKELWERNVLVKYLLSYILLGLVVIAVPKLCGFDYRIHHWHAVFILPLISRRTPLSLVFVGFITGFFVQGIARWDFGLAVTK